MASGKSLAAQLLGRLGARIVSADGINAEILKSEKVAEKLRELFGAHILDSSGRVIRGELAKSVFSSNERLAKLEAFLHPKIRRRAEELFAKIAAARGGPIVYESPLFFEAGIEKTANRPVIEIHSTEEECFKRALRYRKMHPEDVKRRIDRQYRTTHREKMADIVIYNSSSIEALEAKIDLLFRYMVRRKR